MGRTAEGGRALRRFNYLLGIPLVLGGVAFLAGLGGGAPVGSTIAVFSNGAVRSNSAVESGYGSAASPGIGSLQDGWAGGPGAGGAALGSPGGVADSRAVVSGDGHLADWPVGAAGPELFLLDPFSPIPRLRLPGGKLEVPPDADSPPSAVERVRLVEEGRALFASTTVFGQRRSEGPAVAGQLLSCATCHSGQGFADGRSHLVGPVANRPLSLRQTPHLLRIKDSGPFGWDRRNPTIEAQSRGAILSALEMNASREPTLRELAALAAFVETLDAPDAVPGVDFDPEKAALGKRLFDEERGTDPSGEFPADQKISCATCHTGPLLTDRKSHRILALFGDPTDPGETDPQGRMIGFKTPVLRGLRFTAPYFHDGLAGDGGLGVRIPGVSEARNSLRNAVVSFYNNRFQFQFTNPELDALTEFLLSL